ncbi:MAG: HD domain-containing protein, partial [Tissierellia bacterium]|nr:HD domain-containing protein [Tissierellia bacterium]
MDLQDFLKRLHELNIIFQETRVSEAYRMAETAHAGQFRSSGEPYVSHPIQVALILAELELDEDTVIAGLLHDVIEDTQYTHDSIQAKFGKDVAEIVEGVTKIERIQYESLELQQAENFRKMLLAM